MKLRFLLDTNILSEPVLPKPDERVLAHLRAHGSEVATASIVMHELYYGVERLPRSARRRTIERYIDQVLPSMPVLGYDLAAAHWHATERARLEKTGRAVPHYDAQLAAIAAANGLTLVTRNRRDFSGFEDLSCVSWHQPH